MALRRLHVTLTNLDAVGQSQDYLFSLNNGGILTSIKLTWQPYTFLNVGTDEEVPAGGDVHAVVADSTTSVAILGQGTAFDDPIVVPQGGSWEWENPERDGLLDANATISKLQPNAGLAVQPIGLIRGNLRILARAQPLRQVPHSVVIEAELLAFDLNFT